MTAQEQQAGELFRLEHSMTETTFGALVAKGCIIFIPWRRHRKSETIAVWQRGSFIEAWIRNRRRIETICTDGIDRHADEFMKLMYSYNR